jgi:DNA polymerase I-like protein with 3'-5' exonuclease and polymerase domains
MIFAYDIAAYISDLGRRRYFNFTSDRLLKLRHRKSEEIHLDNLRGLTAYDAGLLRAAANAPIQGSSAYMIKIAMVRLHEVLKKRTCTWRNVQKSAQLILDQP